MAIDQVIFIANDNLIQVIGLKDSTTGAFQNSATVTANIFDKDDALIDGPIAMAYLAASNGNYQGTIEDTVAFVKNVLYTAKIDVDAGGGLKAHWELPLRARIRKFT